MSKRENFANALPLLTVGAALGLICNLAQARGFPAWNYVAGLWVGSFARYNKPDEHYLTDYEKLEILKEKGLI